MLKALLAASAITFAAVTSVSAASLASPAAASAVVNADRAQSTIIDAQYRHRDRDSRRVHRERYSHRYVPGRHYSRAPRGWHRFAGRPSNWERRGCIVVGAVWFCP
ncbi:MAG: hypothetical protein IT539_13715 [Bradyrhizobiaceae bacterium]|nr:hypothetical protein [Bradyrhizobiaceae bacterium]